MPRPDEPEKQPDALPLDYARRAAGRSVPPRPGTAAEAILGFLTYAAYLSCVAAAWAAGVHQRIAALALVGLGLLFVLAVYLHLFRNWRGFAAGLALGFGLSCLLIGGGIGYLVYTCKPV